MMKEKYKWFIKPIGVAIIIVVLIMVFYMDNTSPLEEDLSDEIVEETIFEKQRPPTQYSAYSPIPSTRNLKDYYSRRQFPGSPPVIPHTLSQNEGDFNCMNCHQFGGYVSKFSAYAPPAPHPEFVNCQQCHVPSSGSGTEVFLGAGVDWMSVMPAKIKRPAIAGGPPPIPHSLQLRENCLSCHAGPAAVKQIRTTHPERENCTQCHIPQNTTDAWVRR